MRKAYKPFWTNARRNILAASAVLGVIQPLTLVLAAVFLSQKKHAVLLGSRIMAITAKFHFLRIFTLGFTEL